MSLKNLIQAVENFQPAFFGDADILVGAPGFTFKAKDGIAYSEQPIRYGICELIINIVADFLRSGSAHERQRDPFADHGNMSCTKQRKRDVLEAPQIFFHQLWLIVCPAAIGTGN